jgi:cell division protein FtsI/penicillin-binding protein 2
MAMVAATVSHGRTPSPTLIQGRPGTLARDGGEQTPLTDALRTELATMMRETVTDGSASQLADMPDVTGKTGTAQFGDGTRSHGWFIGTRGDLAFAVLVVGGETSRPAVDAAGRFLDATPNP